MVHEIYHTMFERNKIKFYWFIHVATEAHGEILNIIASLDSDVQEYNNPVIELSSMLFLNLFQLFYNERCSHEECLFKICTHWKGWLLEFYFIFCLCSPIFLNNTFMMWSVWSILIPYLPLIMLMLRSFIFGSLLCQIIVLVFQKNKFCVAKSMAFISTTRNDL